MLNVVTLAFFGNLELKEMFFYRMKNKNLKLLKNSKLWLKDF